MFATLLVLLVSLALVGAGLMAGVYFAFSAFIMRAFDRLGPSRATQAMNAINVDILRSAFMPLFFGSTLIHAALVGIALLDADLAGRGWLIAIGLVYVLGMFLCTALFNVPLNNRLAAAESDCTDATWRHYLVYWTRWNHLRAACSLLATLGSLHWLISHA